MEADEKRIYFCYQRNNGSQFSLTHFTLHSPRKVEVNLFRILLKKKKKQYLPPFMQKVHRNLSERTLQLVDKSPLAHFKSFHFTHFTFYVGRVAFSRRWAKRDVSRKKQRGDWYIPSM